jgi:hypothetical protein
MSFVGCLLAAQLVIVGRTFSDELGRIEPSVVATDRLDGGRGPANGMSTEVTGTPA